MQGLLIYRIHVHRDCTYDVEDGDAQNISIVKLKAMLAFWKGLPFLKLSTASSGTEVFMQVFYWKHSCRFFLSSYIFMTFLK